MTGSQFAALIREYTRTNTVTLTNATIVILANSVKEDFAPEIMKADEDLFGVPGTFNLVASTTTREYPLPDDFLKLIRVEAMFDGVTWAKLGELNLVQYKRTTDEVTIVQNFCNYVDFFDPAMGQLYERFSAPKYDIFRKSLFLYSGTITAVVAGLKIFYIAYPADIAASDLSGSTDLSIDPTSTTSSLPRQFHELWARKISILWKGSKEKPIALTEHEQNFDRDFKRKIQSIENPNQDRETFGTTPYNDGSQY